MKKLSIINLVILVTASLAACVVSTAPQVEHVGGSPDSCDVCDVVQPQDAGTAK